MAGLTCCVLWLGTVFTLVPLTGGVEREKGPGVPVTPLPPPQWYTFLMKSVTCKSYTSGWRVHGIILYQCKILHQLIHKVEQRCQVIHARRAEIRNFDPLAAPLLISLQTAEGFKTIFFSVRVISITLNSYVIWMSPSCRHCTGLRPINNALRLLLQSDGEDPLVRNSPGSRLPPVKMGGRLSVCHSTPSVGRQVPEYNACWNSRVWVCHQSWQNVDQLYRGHSWWTQGDENWSERSFSLVRVSFGYSHTWSFTGLVPVHRWVLLK